MVDFTLRVRTKNHSNSALRGAISLPKRCVYRAGSLTTTQEIWPTSYGKRQIVEINTVESIENSRSKLLMKKCFEEAGVPQSKWADIREYMEAIDHDEINIDEAFPILAKRIFGFKGKGMTKIDTVEEFRKFFEETSAKDLDGYYIEQFHNYAKEYRIHCTQDEEFMSWRKLRKYEATERWFFNSENCNWIGVDHEKFDKPSNWDVIIEDCIKAMKATGLDIGSFDVRVQSSSKENPQYILVEVNSAPALGEGVGIHAYKEQLVKVFNNKLNK